MEQTGRLFKQRRLSTTWLKSQITQPHKLWDAMPKQPSQEELRDCIAKVYSGESMSRKTEFKGTQLLAVESSSRKSAKSGGDQLRQATQANPFTSGLAMQAQTSNESRSDNSDNVDQKI